MPAVLRRAPKCQHLAAALATQDLPFNRCRMCGATSYRPVLDRDGAGAMRATGLYRCSGCSVVFADPRAWREGGADDADAPRPPVDASGGDVALAPTARQDTVAAASRALLLLMIVPLLPLLPLAAFFV